MRQTLAIKNSAFFDLSIQVNWHQATPDRELEGAMIVCSSFIVSSMIDDGRSVRPGGDRDREVVR